MSTFQHIFLPHCWVCEEAFIETGGTAQEERHHIIPTAFGGRDGPQVSLCERHHTALHKIAKAMQGNKPYYEHIQKEPQSNAQKLLWLATQVHNAELATRNDPNKRATVLVKLNAKHKRMIDDLKKVYPQLRSREAVLQMALERLFNSHFIK